MNTFSLAWAFRILGILFLAVILAASLLLAEPPEGLREALCPSSERTASPRRGDCAESKWCARLLFI